jgi:curli biogenesis system outer membrane secretion channel CsgG
LRSRATGPLKATVAVGDFQVKAANASNYIGDGLREMLLTALHNTNKFIVVERIDIKGIAAEQALSRSDMARPDQTIAGAGMDIAEVMVYGAVTEFEAEASGSNAGLGFSSIPLNMSHKGKNSHMALDFRVADVRTGRLILTKRIVGSAAASMGSLAGSPTHRGNAMPFSFGAFKNTPMEKAIRDLVNKAVVYISNNLPERYYRHR